MHRRSWTSSIFVTLLASLLALTVPLPSAYSLLDRAVLAQDQSPAATSPTFRTGANYVRVDVYATQNGTPVTDLRQDEFTVLEDGKRQDIDRFELVNIRDGGSAPAFLEPATVSAARRPTTDGRTRLFVLFLDRPHVDDKGSGTIREPLLNTLRRTISDRDLVAVMTPDMAVTELTFSTKTTALERFIERDRFWGERSRLNPVDPFETQLKRCYPRPDQEHLVEELVARRREKRTLDSLQVLIEYLGNLREERKAILLFSSGWLRYEPTSKFDNLGGRPPLAPPAAIVPGRPGGFAAQTDSEFMAACLAERTTLAAVNHEWVFSQIMAAANRANTSFYPVDPRGLAVFDNPDKVLGGASADMAADSRNLSRRLTTLRELAENTDGLAVVNTNSLDAGLRRIVDDLSSYYLLSYASTGELDGKFHSISVRSNRPGVSIRARRGFLAAKAGAPISTRGGAAPPSPAAPDAVAQAARVAFDRLAGSVRDAPARASVAAGWITPGTISTPSFTIVGEVLDKTKGASIDVMITTQDGAVAGSSRGRIDPGSASTIINVAGIDAASPGAYIAHVRIQGDNGTETLRVPIDLPQAPGGTGAIYYRRGQATGNREVATADLRFRRSDRLRVELPAASSAPGEVRLLDRNGMPVNVPLDSSLRTGDDGVRWIVVGLSPAPLAAGDYLVEVATAGQRVLVPFRVVP